MSANEIIEKMLLLEDSAQRENLMRFFKTGKGQYGEGDEFLGIKVPVTRLFAKEAKELALSEIQILLDSKWHEVRLCGFLILVSQFAKLIKLRSTDATHKRDEIVDFYINNATKANNWDLVDLSCYKILGLWLMLPSRYSQEEKVAVLDRLAASPCLWEQRISIVSTMATIKAGKPELALRYASIHLHHPHDLMQKAMGWMLREVGENCGREILCCFLEKNAAQMPRTALRYAIEKMDQKERLMWLAKR